MAGVDKPWIAFKTMAAGTIPPKEALEHTFENGADFVFFGMFDYEIAENAAMAREVLAKVKGQGRSRPWCG
jgi:hypothetical protein